MKQVSDAKILCGVYQIHNSTNHRFYIGSSVNLIARKKAHFRKLRKGAHENQFLQRDFDKCGETGFKFEVLCLTSIERLLFVEQMLLDAVYDNGRQCYNLASTVSAPMQGRKHSPESRLKISQKAMGHKPSSTVFHKGNRHSEEIKIKMRKSHLGKVMSDETKHKISVANKGRKRTEEQIRVMVAARFKNRLPIK